MSKVLKLLLIKKYYTRADKIYYYNLVILIKYTYYIKKKILKYFINTFIRECTAYIAVYIEYNF